MIRYCRANFRLDMKTGKFLSVVALVGLMGLAFQATTQAGVVVGVGVGPGPYYGPPGAYYYGGPGPTVYVGPGYYPWYNGYWGGGYRHVYYGGHGYYHR